MIESMTRKDYLTDHWALLIVVISIIFVVVIMLDLYADYIGYSGTSSSPI